MDYGVSIPITSASPLSPAALLLLFFCEGCTTPCRPHINLSFYQENVQPFSSMIPSTSYFLPSEHHYHLILFTFVLSFFCLHIHANIPHCLTKHSWRRTEKFHLTVTELAFFFFFFFSLLTV
ncbi:hypothetical protein BCR41DRAFT_234304 [Lobosporangium transversale]|uniref:Uncharacterized protein n=1 Tax=Lobosporangium transversale TaxID=64571 RepID=A0A1Y2GWA1_9FUNG|nr:hypothetical protein BCR41DRAFT_234304 [Lobosporangium transversale]ORZ24825.1 hypothetical protein BCR41DRAFT_234304 [Lobosporangium transversale]|eukprot:XP_021883806.1 hypothetical protein BCR41DRAFT_234304 [Lobosporangium transversale]